MSADEFREIYNLAESVGARLLCDEAYRWLDILGIEGANCSAADLRLCGLGVGAISKPLGLPGSRVGWMAGPADQIAECWAMRDYISLRPGKINDMLAILAFKRGEQITKRNQATAWTDFATSRRCSPGFLHAVGCFLSGKCGGGKIQGDARSLLGL